MCVCIYSHFIKNHRIRILKDEPLISDIGHSHQKNKIIPALTRWPRLDWSLTYEPSFFTNLICARRSNETQIMVLLYGQLKLLLLLLPSAACIHFFCILTVFFKSRNKSVRNLFSSFVPESC
jgi:hypothetical protein